MTPTRHALRVALGAVPATHLSERCTSLDKEEAGRYPAVCMGVACDVSFVLQAREENCLKHSGIS